MKRTCSRYLQVFGLLLMLNLQTARAESTPDPLEPMNRGIFWFNNQFDDYLLGPAAKGYKWALPLGVRRCVGNFFTNIATPVYVVSDVLQLKFGQAGTHLERFAINSTIGVAGIFDLAKSEFNLEHHTEDTGSAFGYWGIGEGFYLVIPFLGPSNLRDGIGKIGDVFLNPITYADAVVDHGEYITFGGWALNAIDSRARYDRGIESAKETSLDYYAFMRNTYHQVRQNIIYDDNPPDEPEDAEPADEDVMPGP